MTQTAPAQVPAQMETTPVGRHAARVAIAVFWRPILSVVSGIGLAMAFPPVGAAWVAPLAIAGLTCVVVTGRLRAAIGWGFLTGLCFFTVLLHWLTTVGADAWIALAIFCALWIALVSALSWLVFRLPYWPLWVACMWVLQEALRDRYPLGGFPWGRVAFSQSAAPDVGYAALAGAPIVTFVTTFAGALIACAVLEFSNRRMPAWRPAVVIACIVGAIGLWCGGLLVPTPSAGESAQGPAQATVAVIQGSVPRNGLNAMSQRRAVLDNHVTATLALAAKVKAGLIAAPQAVVWPENSSDIDPLSNPDAAKLISLAADAINAPILVGTVVRNAMNPNTLWNVGLVWQPGTGPSQQYVKRHPVPFGEYVPARSLLTKIIGRYQRVPYDFAAGTTPGVLQLGPVRIGDLICFEVAYDGVVRDVVRAGGRALTVQTNNSTFSYQGWGGAAQPEQQAAISRLRAVEHGRTMLVAATSGISTILAPNGAEIATVPLFAQAEMVEVVDLRESLTLADKLGAGPEVALVITAGVVMIVAVIVRRRKRVSREATTDGMPARVNDDPAADPRKAKS